MNAPNPYAAPQTDPTATPGMWPMPEAGIVTAEVLRSMRETRPWVRFLAVMGFIGSGLVVLSGLGMLGTMGPMSWIGLVYLLMAALYFFPALHLHRYAGSISALVANPMTVTLEDALRHQKSFWRLTGIMTLCVLVLYGLAIAGGITYALMML